MSLPATPPPSAAHRDPPAHSSESELNRRFLVGAVVVLGAAAAMSAIAGPARIDQGRAEDIRRVFDATSALCGWAVFVLCRATWRQTGDRGALWAAAAALVFGLGAACRVAVLLGDAAPGAGWLPILSTAGDAMTPVLFAAGLVPPLLRRRLSPGAITAVALGGVAFLALLMRAVPGLDSGLTVVQLTQGDSAGRVAAGVLVAAAWLGLATVYTLRSFRRRWLYGWVGLMLFALTLSGFAAGATGGRNGWLVGAAVLEAVAALLALAGCYLDLTRAYEDQTLQLSDSEIEAEAAEARQRVSDAARRSQRHDLINAITAIDGAALILEREFDRLSGSDRETLARVLGSGTVRLRSLLSQDGGVEGRIPLSETAAAVASDPEWRESLQVDVSDDLLAAGSPGETAEVVRQLVDYACRRAPGAPVIIRGERDGEWAVLRVEDRGPTMARQLRRTIVDPDNRRATPRDDGHDLRVAARLMRDQGGDLWVEARPGGGSSFGICLPALPAAANAGKDGGRRADA